MPQAHRAFTYVPVPPTYIIPIVCRHCGGDAHLIRRQYHAELNGEIRTFQCSDCKNDTEMTVED